MKVDLRKPSFLLSADLMTSLLFVNSAFPYRLSSFLRLHHSANILGGVFYYSKICDSDLICSLLSLMTDGVDGFLM